MCAIGWWEVVCVVRRKKGSEGDKKRKVDGEEKKKKKRQIRQKKQKKKKFHFGARENRALTPTKKAPRAALSTTGTSGKALFDKPMNTFALI